MDNNWLIYGANGQAGQAIIQEACKLGFRPVMAGRSPQKMADLCVRHGLDTRVWNPRKGTPGQLLRGIRLLVNCAGPYRETAGQLSEVCLQKGVHYLDLSGESQSVESVFSAHQSWVVKGKTAVPGLCPESLVGEALVARLVEQVPGAVSARIVAKPVNSQPASPGRSASFVESLAAGCMIRQQGSLKQVAPYRQLQMIDAEGKSFSATRVAGSELTAIWKSKAIANIEAFRACKTAELASLRFLSYFRPLLKARPVRSFMAKSLWQLQRLQNEPSSQGSIFWLATVEGQDGKSHHLSLQSRSPEELIARTVPELVRRIMEGHSQPGVTTAGNILEPGHILKLATL